MASLSCKYFHRSSTCISLRSFQGYAALDRINSSWQINQARQTSGQTFVISKRKSYRGQFIVHPAAASAADHMQFECDILSLRITWPLRPYYPEIKCSVIVDYKIAHSGRDLVLEFNTRPAGVCRSRPGDVCLGQGCITVTHCRLTGVSIYVHPMYMYTTHSNVQSHTYNGVN